MKKAFTSLNILIALLLSTGLLSLLVSSLNIASQSLSKSYNQEYISSLQIKQILSLSQNVEVDISQLSFLYQGENRKILYVNNKLIMTPGTIIYFLDVDDYKFQIENNRIILSLFRDRTYKYDLGTYE